MAEHPTVDNDINNNSYLQRLIMPNEQIIIM